MKQTDIDFLRDLQRELNTQSNCGQAEPKYWGIMEKKMVSVPDGCGDEYEWYLPDSVDPLTTDEFIQYIRDNYVEEMNSELREEWEDLIADPTAWDMKYFLESKKIIDEVRYVDVEVQDVLSEQTGAFLTRRAAQEYIDRFGYNHSQPRTYAMTAYRNFELERLLEILKTMDVDQLKVDEL